MRDWNADFEMCKDIFESNAICVEYIREVVEALQYWLLYVKSMQVISRPRCSKYMVTLQSVKSVTEQEVVCDEW